MDWGGGAVRRAKDRVETVKEGMVLCKEMKRGRRRNEKYETNQGGRGGAGFVIYPSDRYAGCI